jgi:hypothetical protein
VWHCILWDFWSVNNKLVYGIIIYDKSKYSLLNLHNIVKFDGVVFMLPKSRCVWVEICLESSFIMSYFSNFHVKVGTSHGMQASTCNPTHLRAALHLEAGPICCVRGLKSSLVIGQKAQIGPNPFTPRGHADLVVWFFILKNVCYDTARARWIGCTQNGRPILA